MLGLLSSFVVHPRWSLITYIAVFYLHPPLRWSGAGLPDMRWSLLAAVVTLISLPQAKLPPHATPIFFSFSVNSVVLLCCSVNHLRIYSTPKILPMIRLGVPVHSLDGDGITRLGGYASEPNTDVFFCFDLTITTALLQKSRHSIDRTKSEGIISNFRLYFVDKTLVMSYLRD